MLREERGFLSDRGKSTTQNTSLIGFFLLSSLGLFVLSAAVLLPEYVKYVQLRAERDLLAYQVHCDEKLALYQDRTIRAADSDPILISRMLIRLGNYHPIDCKVANVQFPTNSQLPPVKVLQEAQHPPDFYRGNRLLLLAGQWVKEPFTNRACVIFGLIMLSMSVLFFGKSDSVSRFVNQSSTSNYVHRTSTVRRYRLKPIARVAWQGQRWKNKSPAERKISLIKTPSAARRLRMFEALSFRQNNS